MRGGAYLDNPQYQQSQGLTCAIIHVSPATGYRGVAYLDNPQYFSSNFKGHSCAITYISPATSYEGRGSLAQ